MLKGKRLEDRSPETGVRRKKPAPEERNICRKSEI
jgi:hypothetical protein